MSHELSTQNIKTRIFNTDFPSPLILGSGTLVEKYDQIKPFLDFGAGAVVPRTTRKVMERLAHPSPHLYQSGPIRGETMLNAEWTGASIDYWRPFLDRMAESKRVIMSVSGRDVEGCAKVCQEIDKYQFPFVEVNISCAHSNSVHGMITRNADHIRRVIDAIRQTDFATPLAVKLGHSDGIVELSQVAKDEGADGIVAVNTFGPVFDFDISRGKPQSVVGIAGARGGMSGASLFHIALTDVALISQEVGLPVIACGGVGKAEQAIKMIMAGASGVEIYSAAHVRGINAPRIFSEINRGLISYMEQHNITDIMDLKSVALNLLNQPTNLAKRVPNVIDENCTGCDRCVSVCLPNAFELVKAEHNKAGHVVSIHPDNCVGCGHCLQVCPSEALVMNYGN